MNTNLTVPIESPYPEAPANGTVLPSVIPDIVDWVLVQLRDKNDKSNVLESISGYLMKDGIMIGRKLKKI